MILCGGLLLVCGVGLSTHVKQAQVNACLVPLVDNCDVMLQTPDVPVLAANSHK